MSELNRTTGEHEQYPDVRTRPAPAFITEKYHNLVGLIGEVQRRGAIQDLPSIDVEAVCAGIGSIQACFVMADHDLAQLFGVGEEAGQKYRALTQRLMLWQDLDEVIGILSSVYDRVIADMPRTLQEIEESGGGRDILDPFIVAYTSRLLHAGSVTDLLRTLVSHKCLMKLEDLIGHLHGEILGRAAGGNCVPEPQGEIGEDGKRNKENWHPQLNPFPGADARRGESEFYQIKNKTGSAKGSDGEKLGRQFLVLKEQYPESQRFYVSMIGRTLNGHRSMGAFLRTDPDAEVLVGLAAFQQLGRHRNTPNIVMELYLEVFEAALNRNHYDFDLVVAQMVTEWSTKHGDDDPIFDLLRDSITPSDAKHQSSRTYVGRRKHSR